MICCACVAWNDMLSVVPLWMICCAVARFMICCAALVTDEMLSWLRALDDMLCLRGVE